ncbi:MAG: VWA domain-containing protein [Dehalococcoidia bacterium]
MPSSTEGGPRLDPERLLEDRHALADFLLNAPSLRRGTIAENALAFCGLLRASGIDVTIGRAIDAARALEWVDLTARDEVRAALASTLLADSAHRRLFDAVFEVFWSLVTPPPAQLPPPPQLSGSRPVDGPAARQVRQAVSGDLYGGDTTPQTEGSPQSYSEADLITSKDFSRLRGDELKRVRRLVREIAIQLRTATSRRSRHAAHGHAIDLRRSLRHAARSGGEVRELARRRRQLHRTDGVLLADVSGSMDTYSEFLVQFVYGLQQEMHGVSTFVFSTRLFEVTPMLRARSFEAALRMIERDVDGWSGGTQIGASIAEFNRRFARERVHRRTVVIILSDGWDRGDGDRLGKEMAALRRRARRVIWLNPLLGHEGYEPLAQGMAAALPYCDDFLPANNVESLAAFGRHLLQVTATD